MTGLMRTLQVVGEGDDSTLLKVAFASSDRRSVDQHFGSSQSFVIYGVNPSQAQLLYVSEFGKLAQDGNEDKLATKLELLADCIAVYCCACGASALRQLLSIGVQPVKVAEGAAITGLVADLQNEMREGPSSWLAKAMQRAKPTINSNSRFDSMEVEGWGE
jgi:nitrogen fixation protein NifX